MLWCGAAKPTFGGCLCEPGLVLPQECSETEAGLVRTGKGGVEPGEGDLHATVVLRRESLPCPGRLLWQDRISWDLPGRAFLAQDTLAPLLVGK